MSTDEGTVCRHSEPNSSSDPLSPLAIVLPLRVAAVTNDQGPPVVPRGMYSANSCYTVYTDVYKAGLNAAILLPKWVYIKDRHGRYLSVRSGPTYGTLTFRSGGSVPDLNCAFEAVPYYTASALYTFSGRNGYDIMRYYNDWYSCDGAKRYHFFNVINSNGNRVYLKDNYAPTRFISDQLGSTGAPVAHDYINESSEFEILQAAVKNEITDVKYDIPGAKVREAAPLIVLSTAVFNNSDVDIEKTLEYSFEKWTVGTWNNAAGIEIGAKATFEAGVPFVASAEFEISVSASYSYEWGGEEGKKQAIKTSTTVKVPPRMKAFATVIVRNAQIDVGFTYTQKILWSNGQSEQTTKTGIYNNVDSWHVDVVLDNMKSASEW